MQRKQNSLVPVAKVIADLPGPVQAIREASPQALHHFTQADQVNQLVSGQRSGPRPGLHGAADGTVQLPRTNSRQPAPVQARQRPLQAHHDCRWRQQTPLRQLPASDPGLDVYRSGADPEPSHRPGPSLAKFMRTLGVYSSGGGKRGYQAPQSDAAAVRLHCATVLQRRE